jgi:hypothetical protein
MVEQQRYEQHQGYSRSCHFVKMTQLLAVTISLVSLWNTDGFVPPSVTVCRTSHPFNARETSTSPSSSSGLQRQDCRVVPNHPQRKQRRRQQSFLYGSSLDDDDDFDEDDDDDDDDDEYIDTELLGDWRNFRRSLAIGTDDDGGDGSSGEKAIGDSITAAMASNEREVTENEKVLEEQNKELAEEYASGIWAHQISTVSAMRCDAMRYNGANTCYAISWHRFIDCCWFSFLPPLTQFFVASLRTLF